MSSDRAAAFLVLWVGLAFITRWVAGQRELSKDAWLGWGIVFGPLALVAVFLVRPGPRVRPPRPVADRDEAAPESAAEWSCTCGARNPARRTTCYRCRQPRTVVLDRLAELVAMHADGRLSDDEFAAAMRQTLGL